MRIPSGNTYLGIGPTLGSAKTRTPTGYAMNRPFRRRGRTDDVERSDNQSICRHCDESVNEEPNEGGRGKGKIGLASGARGRLYTEHRRMVSHCNSGRQPGRR